MFSVALSSVNDRVAPSRITVTSHCACPGSTAFCGTWTCLGRLVAKRSTRTFASGTPRAASAPVTDSIMPSGPQT